MNFLNGEHYYSFLKEIHNTHGKLKDNKQSYVLTVVYVLPIMYNSTVLRVGANFLWGRTLLEQRQNKNNYSHSTKKSMSFEFVAFFVHIFGGQKINLFFIKAESF